MAAPAPKPSEVRVFEIATDFRQWLEKHHTTATQQWVGYYKKGVSKTSMTYAESVEEALCFGWIDGITRRIDDEVFTTRFTPRTNRSTWSAANISKMERLIANGRAHPAGIRAFESRAGGSKPEGAT